MPVAASRAPAAEASVRIAADPSAGERRGGSGCVCHDLQVRPRRQREASRGAPGAAKSSSVNRKNVEIKNQFKTLNWFLAAFRRFSRGEKRPRQPKEC